MVYYKCCRREKGRGWQEPENWDEPRKVNGPPFPPSLKVKSLEHKQKTNVRHSTVYLYKENNMADKLKIQHSAFNALNESAVPLVQAVVASPKSLPIWRQILKTILPKTVSDAISEDQYNLAVEKGETAKEAEWVLAFLSNADNFEVAERAARSVDFSKTFTFSNGESYDLQTLKTKVLDGSAWALTEVGATENNKAIRTAANMAIKYIKHTFEANTKEKFAGERKKRVK